MSHRGRTAGLFMVPWRWLPVKLTETDTEVGCPLEIVAFHPFIDDALQSAAIEVDSVTDLLTVQGISATGIFYCKFGPV